MNSIERAILKVFERQAAGVRNAVTLGVMLQAIAVEINASGDAEALHAAAKQAVAELVAKGLLSRMGPAAGNEETYARTEDGRLAVASPLDVTLYTRPGCHLCDEAKTQIAPLLRKAGTRLHEVNIDADEVLRQRYNVDVPVIFLGARKVAKHRVDLGQFQRQLDDARRTNNAGDE